MIATNRPIAAPSSPVHRTTTCLVAAVVVAVMVLFALRPLLNEAPQMDEGVLLTYPDLMSRLGLVVHRDFQSFYGPGNLWLLEAVYRIFGPSVGVERLAGAAYRAAIATAILALTVRWGLGIAITGTVLAALVLVSLPAAAFAILLALAAALWSIFLADRVGAGTKYSAGMAAGAGALAMVTTSVRPELAPVVVVAALAALRPWRRQTLVLFATGMVFGGTPLALHVIVASPQAVLNNIFVDAVLRAGPYRRLPVPPTNDRVLRESLLLAVSAAILGVAAIASIARVGWSGTARDARARIVIALALFAGGLAPEAFERLDSDHVYYVLAVAAALLPAATATLAGAAASRWGRLAQRFPVAIGCVLFISLSPEIALPPFLYTVLVLGGASPRSTVVSRMGRSFPITQPEDAHDVTRAVQAAASGDTKGARLFVGPTDLRRTTYGDSYIYFLFPDMSPASYYLEMEPNTGGAAGGHLATDISQADVLILNAEWDRPHDGANPGPAGPSLANVLVRSRFCEVAHAGTFLVYKKCSRSAGG